MRTGKKYLAALLLFYTTALFAFSDVVIENNRKQTVFYYSEGLMYRGGSVQGKPIFMYNPNDHKIYQGTGSLALGTPLASWANESLYPENRTSDPPLYIYRNHGIHTPASGSVAVAYLDGTRLYEGANNAGQVMYYFSAPLPTPVAVYLLTVKDEPPPVSVVYSGLPDQGGKPLLCIFENRIYRGNTAEGEPLYTMDPQTMKFYRGARVVEGKAEYSIGRDNKIYQGDGTDNPSRVLMSISGYSFYAKNASGENALGSFAAERPLFSRFYKGYLKKGDKPTQPPILVLPDGITIAAKFFLIYKLVCEPQHPEKKLPVAETKPAPKPAPVVAKPVTKTVSKPTPVVAKPVQKTTQKTTQVVAKPVQKTESSKSSVATNAQSSSAKSKTTSSSTQKKKQSKKTKSSKSKKKVQQTTTNDEWM